MLRCCIGAQRLNRNTVMHGLVFESKECDLVTYSDSVFYSEFAYYRHYSMVTFHIAHLFPYVISEIQNSEVDRKCALGYMTR